MLLHKTKSLLGGKTLNLGKETMCGFEVTKSEKERCEKSYTEYAGISEQAYNKLFEECDL